MLAIVKAIYKMVCLYFPFPIKARSCDSHPWPTPRSHSLHAADMNIPGWIHGQAPCRQRYAQEARQEDLSHDGQGQERQPEHGNIQGGKQTRRNHYIGTISLRRPRLISLICRFERTDLNWNEPRFQTKKQESIHVFLSLLLSALLAGKIASIKDMQCTRCLRGPCFTASDSVYWFQVMLLCKQRHCSPKSRSLRNSTCKVYHISIVRYIG